MADGTEIVKLKTIVNLKSRQAGSRAKKRCGRGESRETEDRGRWKLRQGRKGRREKRGGAAMRREENGVGGRQNGDESGERERPGRNRRRRHRRENAGERTTRESGRGGGRRKGNPSLEKLPARGRGELGTRMRRTACGDASGERPLKRKSAAGMEWQRRRAVEGAKLWSGAGRAPELGGRRQAGKLRSRKFSEWIGWRNARNCRAEKRACAGLRQEKGTPRESTRPGSAHPCRAFFRAPPQK